MIGGMSWSIYTHDAIQQARGSRYDDEEGDEEKVQWRVFPFTLTRKPRERRGFL